MAEPLPDVSVSIQLGHEHLCAGVLGDHDLVLAPFPPPQLSDPEYSLDVVTIPDPLGEDRPVERLRIGAVNLLWFDGDRDRPVAAVVKLATPSIYAPTMRPFNGGLLGSALDRTGGDLWAALEQLGTIDPGVRSGPSPEVLAKLPEIERRQRGATYRDHHLATPVDVGWSLCRWLLVCQPD